MLFPVQEIILHRIHIQFLGLIAVHTLGLEYGIGLKGIDQRGSTAGLLFIIGGYLVIGVQAQQEIGWKGFGVLVDAPHGILKGDI
jgi:hypothetical protein